MKSFLSFDNILIMSLTTSIQAPSWSLPVLILTELFKSSHCFSIFCH